MNAVSVSDLMDKVFDSRNRHRDAARRMRIEGGSIKVFVNRLYEYDIPLRECETIHGVLRWIEHMREKSWMTDEMLSRLIALMDEHNEGR